MKKETKKLTDLEDGSDLRIIAEIAAKATAKANKTAKEKSQEFIEVINGEIIRKTKGKKKTEVIAKLHYRSVQKGEVSYYK